MHLHAFLTKLYFTTFISARTAEVNTTRGGRAKVLIVESLLLVSCKQERNQLDFQTEFTQLAVRKYFHL